MDEGTSVDRQSPVPYYQQVADALEAQVASGSLAQGERLPSEKELGVEYGLARATIRQALQHLEFRGVVQRVPNRGVFVGSVGGDRGWMIQNTAGFLENAVGRQNRAVTTEVLRHGEVELPEYVTYALGVPAGTRGFELVRLRHLDGVPAVYSVNYSPPVLVPVVAAAAEVLDGSSSLSELLTRSGYPLTGARRTIRALNPTKEIAGRLKVALDTPMLCVRSTSWSTQHRVFDVYETWVRSDVVPLEVDVSVVDQGAAGH